MMRMLPRQDVPVVFVDFMSVYLSSFLVFSLDQCELGTAKSATLFTPDRNWNGPLLCKGREMF